MRALTLTQPWATLVAVGRKRFETRSWSTSYRGPLALHAAKAFPQWAQALCAEPPFWANLECLVRSPADLPRGMVIAKGLLYHRLGAELATAAAGLTEE